LNPRGEAKNGEQSRTRKLIAWSVADDEAAATGSFERRGQFLLSPMVM